MINPILNWTEDDVWEFLHHYGCESNPLYQCGRKRIGCIGCPMQGKKGMRRDFRIYPKYYHNYIRAFDKMLEAIKRDGAVKNLSWETGEDVMHWWISDVMTLQGQTTFDGFDILDV
jgi:phosphoadenosine phosphosulfate reductase